MSDWGVDVRRVLGCFIKAPWVLREMVKELEKNQIIKKGALELALTGSEDRVFRGVLDIVRYDYRLARLLSMPCPNPRARRLRVQIAVYILLKEDWPISTTSLPPDIHWGWGSSLSSCGELWHGLASWKRISRDCSDFENLDAHVTREVCDSSGQLTLRSDGAVLFRVITRQLELTLNEIGKDFDNVSLPAHNIKDESEELPMDQLIEVWGDVSTSFYDQIVMTRRVAGDDDDEPRFEHSIWSTGVPVLLKVENNVDLFNEQNFDVLSTEFNCNVVFGICMKFLRLEDSSLVGVQWSLIPPMFV
ncbi:hypothetical protein ACHAPI_011077 [Fusarium lateritium]